MSEKTKLLVSVAPQLFRQNLLAVLNSHSQFIAFEAHNYSQLIILTKIHKPNIILLDINLVIEDIDQSVAAILQNSMNSEILCFSSNENYPYLDLCFKAGARSAVSFNTKLFDLIKAIKTIKEGHTYIDRTLKFQSLALSKRTSNDSITSEKLPIFLTTKEVKIVEFLKNGLTSKEIAFKLSVSTKTIELKRSIILKKLKVKNTAALINYIKIQPSVE